MDYDFDLKKSTLDDRMLIALDLIVDAINGMVPGYIIQRFQDLYRKKFNKEPEEAELKLAFIVHHLVNLGIGNPVGELGEEGLALTPEVREKLQQKVRKYAVEDESH